MEKEWDHVFVFSFCSTLGGLPASALSSEAEPPSLDHPRSDGLQGEVHTVGPCSLPGPSVSCCALSFQVDLDTGLSEFAVTQRRLVHGWNEFVSDSTEPVWKKYLDQVGPRCPPALLSPQGRAAAASPDID